MTETRDTNMAEPHHHSEIFPPPESVKNEAFVTSIEQYKELYQKSIDQPEEFWSKIAEDFYWQSAPTGKFLDFNFDVRNGPIYIKWMEGAKTNLCYNAVDRHVANGLGDRIAFYWEGNNPDDDGQITYSELKDRVCQFANVLKSLGTEKGDRVAIYMPMIVDITVAMLACARLGIIHSIVFGGFSVQSLADRLIGARCSVLVTAGRQTAMFFGGFSAESLADRILDAKCSVVITSDGVWRGTKLLNLKDIVDSAVQKCEQVGHTVEHVIVCRHLSPFEEILIGEGDEEVIPAERPCRHLRIKWHPARDKWWHELVEGTSTECPPVWLDAEDPLFMLYTSGSTGKPKGVVHTQAGYMLYSATTFKYDFDYHPDDIFWCTADVGWITGHTYVTYGPLVNAATSVIFEGVPTYPDPGRFWRIVEKYKVTKFYTAPTAIRSLMGFGDEHVTKYNRDSLKVIATVGEPINPEAWLWYYNVVGNKKCAVVDTFWQTETGGHVITPLPGATPTKPGSATFPFFGVVPVILNEEGKEVEDDTEGYIVFKQPWPGIMRTVYGNQQRFETTYFKKFPGYYTTGDGGRRDKDGYIWVTGRIDDMVNVSAHLLSTAEIESSLVEHKAVTEAAVVAHPHKIKGECTYCFVTLKQGFTFTADLIHELRAQVRAKIGPFAAPDFIQEAPGLPKTRSGKIMRRVLRKIAVGDRNIGDVSTMADETVVDKLFQLRPEDA